MVWCKAFYKLGPYANLFSPNSHGGRHPTITAELTEAEVVRVVELATAAAPPGTTLEKILEVTDDGHYLRTLFPE